MIECLRDAESSWPADPFRGAWTSLTPRTIRRTSRCWTGSRPLGCGGWSSGRSAISDRAGRARVRGLGAVGTFVFEDFHSPAADRVVLGAADAALDAIVATGGTLLVLIDRPCAERAATAGRSERARGSSSLRGCGCWALRRCAEKAAARGVRAVVHPHAGGYLEFEDEIERLLARRRRTRAVPGHRARAVRRQRPGRTRAPLRGPDRAPASQGRRRAGPRARARLLGGDRRGDLLPGRRRAARPRRARDALERDRLRRASPPSSRTAAPAPRATRPTTSRAASRACGPPAWAERGSGTGR